MFRINHILKKPDEIVPWGGENKSLHWYGLTDGLLWIEVGDSVIYEYTETHDDEMGKPIIYNDYQLSRFMEDFFGILPFVAESVPDYLYKDIELFYERMNKWDLLHYDLSDEEYNEFYFGIYGELDNPIFLRKFDSGHLIGGPDIGCVRHEDKIKIYWRSCEDENKKSLWTSPQGVYEMDYEEFVNEVFRFYNAFFKDMDKQVENVKNNGLPGVYVDIEALCRENETRKDSFKQKIDMLKSEQKGETDWDKNRKLYKKMLDENADEKI